MVLYSEWFSLYLPRISGEHGAILFGLLSGGGVGWSIQLGCGNLWYPLIGGVFGLGAGLLAGLLVSYSRRGVWLRIWVRVTDRWQDWLEG